MKPRDLFAWLFSALLVIGVYAAVCVAFFFVFRKYRVPMLVGVSVVYWGIFAFLAVLRKRANKQ
jgi:hypothetical protein